MPHRPSYPSPTPLAASHPAISPTSTPLPLHLVPAATLGAGKGSNPRFGSGSNPRSGGDAQAPRMGRGRQDSKRQQL
ncbi:hypothetical protein E2562_018878 [Oryza meyeriana var. granulata]|uniref:Uncharacterized protein n=1 Tax=Oryza meyeriana var. granulata TaxID=110450 RepID=A0A6G1F9W1_9ORYZ|nr:hypothetical protein E2562_018878 [Oryza meyeriana var. granulata]